MAPNLRANNTRVPHVWSNKRDKFVRVDDELRCGSRQLASLLAFVKHKFHDEFEVFVEGCDVSGVDVFSDILLSAASADNQEEVDEEEEEVDCKILPSNEEGVGSSKKTTTSSADSVDGAVLKEPQASSSRSVRLPSSGVEKATIENRESEKAVKNGEQRTPNVNHNNGAGNPVVPQTSTDSQTSANSKKPSERMPKAATLEIPSSSSSFIRLTRLQKKQELKKECDLQISNRLRSSKSKVPPKELPNTSKLKEPVKRRNTDKRRNSIRSFQKAGKSEGNCADSLAPGGNSVDSGPSKNSRETGGKKKRKKVAVPTRRTKLGKSERQQTRIAPTSDLECPICKKIYSTKGNLKMHKETHNSEKKFKCILCPKSFHQNIDLRRHQRTHTNEKPFKCSFCVKCFRQSTERRSHERIHRNLKPFKCPACSKCFRHVATLRRHKLRHSKKKPYICCVCPKAFRTASQLSRHEQIHRFE